MSIEEKVEGYLYELIDKLDRISDIGITASDKVEKHLLQDDIMSGLESLLSNIESELNNIEVEVGETRDLINSIRKNMS